MTPANRVRKVFSDLSRMESVDDSDLIREALGLDSLDYIEALFKIEESLGIQIGDSEAEAIRSVGHAVALVESKLEKRREPANLEEGRQDN